MEKQTSTYQYAPPQSDAGFEQAMMVISFVLIGLFFPVSICLCVKHVKKREKVKVYRHRKFKHELLGPKYFFIIPCVDSYFIEDARAPSIFQHLDQYPLPGMRSSFVVQVPYRSRSSIKPSNVLPQRVMSVLERSFGNETQFRDSVKPRPF